MRQEEPQQWQQQGQRVRFFWVLLIMVACLACIYFYVIPFLGFIGNGMNQGGGASAGGWSDTRQRQIAFDLAQNVQNYRHRINERRVINYGDAYMQATGVATPFRPQIPYEGVNARSGAQNSTHSEAKLKGWAQVTIQNNLQGLPSGSTINVLIFTQVKLCPSCRKDAQTWAKDLQKYAPSGVTVNLYIWQQKNFDKEHPDQTPVRSVDDVELALSVSAS